jgi:alkaline phosphatase D
VAVVSLTVGAVTSSTARVIADIAGSTARLAVSDSPDLSTPAWFTPDGVSSDGAHRFTAEGLSPSSEYFYGVEDDGVLDTVTTGRFRTHAPVGLPWSHTVATIGDAGLSPVYPGSGTELLPSRISNAPTFDTVRLANPDMVAHLGDLTYYDLGSGDHGVVGGGSVDNYRRMFTDVFAQSRQHRLYREVPFQYMWDNHDYGYTPSPGYPDGTVPGKGIAAQVYRERIPHYPTPEATGSPYQSWQMGRVLYILNDTRYNRSFTLDPDSPTKTMLGEQQLDWMFNLLQTTTAEALVWLMPTPWLHDGGQHTWGAFSYERAAIVNFLTTTPVPASGGARMWSQSMVQVSADIHALGLCSPQHNPYGNFPVMLTAGIDATPHHGNDAQYNLGYQGGREQWGTVGVADDGTQITITLTGWYQSSPWGSQSLTVETPGAVPPLPVAPPVYAQASARREVQWLGVHRVTGQILCELPDVECSPRIQLSAYASSSVAIPLASDKGHLPIQSILAATDGRLGSIVAVVNDIPIWMGLPANRHRGSDGKLHVPSANTPESYLLKRLARDAEFVNADRSRVALALAQQAEALNGLGQGLGFEYDVTDTGDLITIGYTTTDRMKIYNAIRDLCAAGLEFTVGLDWADASQTRIVKILRIARRIGVLDAPNPPVLDTDVSVVSYKHNESWADDDYANHITAIGPGQGDSQPASSPAIDAAALSGGYPIVESVISPGNNVNDNTNLQAFADADLVRRRNGVQSIEIEASLYEGPRPSIHARIGDMVGYRCNGPGHPKPTIEDPTDYALVGSGRLTGMLIDPVKGTWVPGLVDDPTLEAL